MRRRHAYLDLLKTLAMVCVCMYHFPMIQHTAYARPFGLDVLCLRFFRAFNAVCVPLFMMVNGALVLNRPFCFKKHASRCFFLLIGVYVWYVLTQVLGHAWQSGWSYVAENWAGILRSAQYLYEYDGIGTSHLWFVQMLVAIYLIVPVIYAGIESKDGQIQQGMLFLLGAMGFLAFLLQDISHVRAAVPVLRSLDFSALETINPLRGMYGAMLVYFVLGGLMHRRRAQIARIPLWVSLSVIATGWLILFAEWYLVTIRTEAMYDIVYGGYNCLPTLMMSMGLFAAAARLEEKLALGEGKLGRMLALIGRNTLAVYYLHWILGLTLLQLVSVPGSIAVNLVKAVVMVLVCSLAGEGLRRVSLLRCLL